MSDEEYIARELAKFFKDEPHKAVLWLLTPNLHFGGIAPAHLITIRGPSKVRAFIEAQIYLNSPPDEGTK